MVAAVELEQQDDQGLSRRHLVASRPDARSCQTGSPSSQFPASAQEAGMTAPVLILHGPVRPSAAQQAAALPDLGQGLRGPLEPLSADPTPWACETFAPNLACARRSVLRLREALMPPSTPPPTAPVTRGATAGTRPSAWRA